MTVWGRAGSGRKRWAGELAKKKNKNVKNMRKKRDVEKK